MEGSSSSSAALFFGIRGVDEKKMKASVQPHSSPAPAPAAPPKKRRNQPGNPNPDAEVIALSPKALMATNRFLCEVCNKGFQREQNLQLHRRGHNLPWKLKQNTTKEVKRKVYLCPEPSCVHHDPSRALGDLTGIKKHFSRKHGEKKYKCQKCSKMYAVQSDWKAHSKTCGTKEYRCDCGTLFSRRDSFVTHRAFCDALAQEGALRNPPSLGAIGSSLFGSNHISLGLSSQISSKISPLQDHDNLSCTDLLSLGNPHPTAVFKKFENDLIGSSTASAFRPTQIMPTSGFFMPEQNQEFDEQNQSDHENGLFPNKAFQGLVHLPNLQDDHANNNNNNNSPSGTTLFNFSFFASGGTTNNSNSNSSLIVTNQFSNGSEGGSSLFSGSIIGGASDHMIGSSVASLYAAASGQNPNMAAAHISATALLQKAAAMGSTASNNSASNLLRSYGSSSSSGTKSDSGLPGIAASFGNVFGGDNNENNLNELMNSLAGGGGANYSIFGGGTHRYVEHEQEDSYRGGGYDVKKIKLEQPSDSPTLSFGGSDRMTRDFLGVGEIMRSMSGGSSQRETASAYSVPRNHAFGGGNFR